MQTSRQFTTEAGMPGGVAHGPRARAALAYWKARHLACRIAQGMCRPVAAERMAPGTGVWVSRPGCGDEISFMAAHVSQWNEIAQAYHVIPDHDPHRPFFAGASRVVRRFVGEVAPGVERYCP